MFQCFVHAYIITETLMIITINVTLRHLRSKEFMGSLSHIPLHQGNMKILHAMLLNGLLKAFCIVKDFIVRFSSYTKTFKHHK